MNNPLTPEQKLTKINSLSKITLVDKDGNVIKGRIREYSVHSDNEFPVVGITLSFNVDKLYLKKKK